MVVGPAFHWCACVDVKVMRKSLHGNRNETKDINPFYIFHLSIIRYATKHNAVGPLSPWFRSPDLCLGVTS